MLKDDFIRLQHMLDAGRELINSFQRHTRDDLERDHI